MRKSFLVLFFIVPVLVFAFSSTETKLCLKNGYTVATVNGVLVDEKGANDNMVALKKKLGLSFNSQPIDYEYLLNPSHGGGLSDIIDAIVQGYLEQASISDYDLEEMISAASEKVTTQKLLLVAHSQGNFYANSFYDAVVKIKTDGDIPPESLGVYAVATPADRVAGGGTWLTSDTDKVIAGVVGHLPMTNIMKPNTHIVLESDDDILGHAFGDVYLKHRGVEIVAGIRDALNKLKTNDIQSEMKPCISTPSKTLAHRLKGAALAVADPIASASGAIVVGTVDGVYGVSVFAFNTAKNLAVSTIDFAVTGVRAGYNNLATLVNGISNMLGGKRNQSSVLVATQNLVNQKIAVLPTSKISRALPLKIAIPLLPQPSAQVTLPLVNVTKLAPHIDVSSVATVTIPAPVVAIETASALGVVSAKSQIADMDSDTATFISTPVASSHYSSSRGGQAEVVVIAEPVVSTVVSEPGPVPPSDTTSPSVVSDLSLSDATLDSIKLNWTTPGDDNTMGTATSYDVRYGTAPITVINWIDAMRVGDEPIPSIAGTSQSLIVYGLSASTTYYFAIKTSDEVPNVSELSNVPNLSTLTPLSSLDTTASSSLADLSLSDENQTLVVPSPLDMIAPGSISDLILSDETTNSVKLSWTSPGDDDATGTAALYDVRYSTLPVTEDNWSGATQVVGLAIPLVAGSSQSLIVSGLSASTTYYFAIRSSDEVSNISALSNVPSTNTLVPPPPSDVIPPDAPVVISPDTSDAVFAVSHLIFSGTAEVGSTIYANVSGLGEDQASTTAALDGSWLINLDLADGRKHLDFYAVDASGNISSSTSRDITIDTVPPTVTVSVAECQKSISLNSCLTMSPDLNISWSANEDGIDHYIINKNGVISFTNSTSTMVVAVNDSQYVFSVFAVDKAGNRSATISQIVNVSQMPVIINELAWGGTTNHPEDEWVELYNRSSQDIDLGGFTLYSKTDMTPYVNLLGTVVSHGYFLIEAKNTGETDPTTEAPIKNVTPGMWVSFGERMNNSGENMLLSYASSTVDQVPYCFNWCGVPTSRTTERYDSDSSGNSSSNWSANNGDIYNGLNVDGAVIMGTPGARNSLNYLINRGSNISSNLTLTKKLSPYLIDNVTQTILQGSTLNVEPGVVIKFRNAARLSADGNIVADGTSDNPIVFTSFADDSYGGNTDGITATPVKGAWFGVELSNKSVSSLFDHTLFRYGGNYGTGATYRKAMLYATQVSPQVSNSTFEYSKAYGAYLSGTNSNVTNNIFQFNSGDANSVGLYIDQGAPSVMGNTFTQNALGLYVNSSAGAFSNNNFSGNTITMQVVGPVVGSLLNNMGGASDMINLLGTISVSGATTTLVANPMPYFLQGTVTVPLGSTLDIKDGTVIKNSINGSASLLSVFGKLNIDTSSNTGVIFQSNQATLTKGGWMGIVMNSGSSSHVKGATIRDASTGIKYTSSPIWLENVNFTNNTTAVQSSGSIVKCAVDVIFSGNTTNKSPSGLW